jgi:hypothetical protein
MRPRIPHTTFAFAADDLRLIDECASTLTAKTAKTGRIGSRADAIRAAIREYHERHVTQGEPVKAGPDLHNVASRLILARQHLDGALANLPAREDSR